MAADNLHGFRLHLDVIQLSGFVSLVADAAVLQGVLWKKQQVAYIDADEIEAEHKTVPVHRLFACQLEIPYGPQLLQCQATLLGLLLLYRHTTKGELVGQLILDGLVEHKLHYLDVSLYSVGFPSLFPLMVNVGDDPLPVDGLKRAALVVCLDGSRHSLIVALRVISALGLRHLPYIGNERPSVAFLCAGNDFLQVFFQLLCGLILVGQDVVLHLRVQCGEPRRLRLCVFVGLREYHSRELLRGLQVSRDIESLVLVRDGEKHLKIPVVYVDFHLQDFVL